MSMTEVGRNTMAGEALRGFVERLENIEAQKKQLTDDAAAIKAEAKAQGFITKAITFILKKRKMRPSDRQEAEAIEDTYLHAMGMLPDTPLFRHVNLMAVDIMAREQVIESMKQFVPSSGSITIEAGGAPVRLTRDIHGNVSVTEVVEKPIQTAEAPGKKQGKAKPQVPDVDAAGAEALGRQAHRDDQPIIGNPFPYGDTRRARWDRGWRDESGGDGMGPGEDD
jgi:uncharacterized protein (UPF0335 family)